MSDDEQLPAEINAINRLAFHRERFPDLNHKLGVARVSLAAAIIAMDDAEGLAGRHNLQEQALVEFHLRAYGQALADLLRGEES